MVLLVLDPVGEPGGLLPSSNDFAFPYNFVLMRTTFMAGVVVVVLVTGAERRLLVATVVF